ncbi:ribosome biogenesis protein WDR12 homolog isoform X1 [Juglans regia]|uniref:Ribosome biogenesis protein WDR12 homolog n=2 Tax=Juglans regia TaxID=51240 RepID=A0A6P9EUT9_JUGRE|nr:ribosome biogenesis protein WDR12 homolog isoform X1 [Juglans regia]
MDIDGEAEENSRRVQVRFVTKLKPPLKAPPTSIAIPPNLTRLGLSTLVNNLLQSAGNPDWKLEPFDFLIDGELVRMSLEKFLLAKGISAEKVLEIEYIKAVAPRKEEEPSFHDDWVSAVDGSDPRFIVTGCYDGLARLWKASGVCTHVLEGHSDVVASVGIINPEGAEAVTLATASKDRTLRLWKFDTEEPINNPINIRAFKILRGHRESVQSVAAQKSGDMVCSGSWDSTINLWRTNDNTDGDLVSIKKRKVNDQADESQLEGEAMSTLVGHTQCVSSVVWPQHDTIYSASWDHSVRRWDVETGKDLTDIFCGKVLTCIDVGGESSALIAAGASDPILRIWDPRKPGTSAPVFQFSSHTSWVSACKWHKKSWFHLATASYDGKVMLWDLRTAWPLAIIESHKDKVLCADWWRGDSVVSGGADSKLSISSGIPVL